MLLVHNQDAPSWCELEPHIGIENGTKELKDGWANLGLAVLRLENPSEMLLRAVIAVLSRQSPHPPIQYPKMYKYFFFFTTGHGASESFYTKDGYVSFCDVVNSFRNELPFRSCFYWFDCCRSQDLRIPKSILLEPEFGECIVYSTMEKSDSWGPDGEVSFLAKELIRQLEEDCSMNEMIESLKDKVFYTVLRCTTQRPQVNALFSDPKEIRLMREFHEAGEWNFCTRLQVHFVCLSFL